MSYRHRAENKAAVCDIAPPIDIHILNGTASEIMIPCSYLADGVLTPIDLSAEGYGDPVLAIDRPLDGLTWDAKIIDSNVIHLVINAQCPNAIDVDVTRDISLLIADTATMMPDSVIRGRLLIVASPLAPEFA